MQPIVVLAAFAAQLVSIVLQTWLVPGPVELFATSSQVWAIWFGRTCVVLASGALAWLVFRAPRLPIGTSLILVLLGGAAGYAWPVAFALGLEIPVFLTRWIDGPALPQWQGIITAVIGLAAALRAVPRRGDHTSVIGDAIDRGGGPAPSDGSETL